jgi:outer membrane protein OmpA-like peptidoglycan-associated protein
VLDAGGPAVERYDADGDGVPDARDRCPEQAGVDAVDSMQAGCPARPCLSMVAPSQIEVTAKIYFESGKSDLDAQAGPIVESVARALHDNPELELEAIGHCDSTEPDDLGLSRARRVRDAILARAISPARIGASGEGSRRPAASNASAAGRARNRRVEFVTRGPKRPLGSP